MPKPKSSRKSGKLLKTTVWDPTEYLQSPKAIASYLEAAFEDGDPALIAAALGDVATRLAYEHLGIEMPRKT